MATESAEAMALQVLAWLVSNSDVLGVFMGSTGLSEQDLRNRAGDRDVLIAVLDFLVMDDAWVSGFCESQGVPFDAPMRARAALSGGEVHWT